MASRKVIIACAAVMAAAAAGVAALGVYTYRMRPIVPDMAEIKIGSDAATYASLRDSLEGKVTDDGLRFLDRISDLTGFSERIRPGHYTLRKGMSASGLINMIASGSQTAVSLTFNNVRTVAQLCGRISSQIEADSADMAALLMCDTVPPHYGFTAETFPSMFIPNTYQVWWTSTPEQIADRMRREWDSFWNDERQSKADALGMTREQVSTLASIVAEETNAASEMPTIAGVYANRLEKGMPLQADPTVRFAVGDFTLRRILTRHLETESPYNTYRHAGLPPGPIAIPPITAIDAVLNRERHGYYYFCAKEDFSGTHRFAATLAEHNRNARIYQEALNKAGIR